MRNKEAILLFPNFLHNKSIVSYWGKANDSLKVEQKLVFSYYAFSWYHSLGKYIIAVDIEQPLKQ
jgi:hypothetical protein